MTRLTAALHEVRLALSSLGYEEEPATPKRNEPIWLIKPSSAVQFATLISAKRRLSGLSVSFGASFPPATACWRSRMEVLEPFLHPVLRENAFGDVDRPCPVLFSAGRVLKWPLLVIDATWPAYEQRRELQRLTAELLQPLEASVKTPRDVGEFLLRDDEPYEWRATNGLIRSAEVATNLQHAGASIAEVQRRLGTYAHIVQQQAQLNERPFDMTMFLESLLMQT